MMLGLSGWRRCLPVLALVGIAACASPRYAERETYLKEHRGLSPPVRLAIEQGRVIPGMTQEEVILVAGEPIHKQRRVAGSVPREVWIYPAVLIEKRILKHAENSERTVKLIFEDFRVVAIEEM